MGEHRGWVVQPRGKRFRARAWDPHAGRYLSKTFDSDSKAKVWAKEEHARLLTRQTSAAKAVTAALAEEYLDDLARRKRSASHIRDSRLVLRRLAKVLPDPTIGTAAKAVRDWMIADLGGLAGATRNRYLVTSKSLLDWAVIEGKLHKNPLAPVRAETLDDTLKPQFALGELRTLLWAFADHYHTLFVILIYTGMRIDEAAHLRWEDCDFEGRNVAVLLAAGAKIKRRKERLIPMQLEFAAFLQSIRPADASGPIVGAVGQHRGERLLRFMARHAIPDGDRTPHSTRHTYAGLMTATAIPESVLAAYMGHRPGGPTTAGYTKMAQWFVRGVEGWARGEFRLLEGAVSSWPRVVVDLAAKGGASRSEAKTAAARENGKRFGGRPSKKTTEELL